MALVAAAQGGRGAPGDAGDRAHRRLRRDGRALVPQRTPPRSRMTWRSKRRRRSGEPQELAGKEAKARGKAQEQERIALDKAEQLAREDYVNRVNRAYREIQDDNVALAEDLLHGCEPRRRGWEWHFVERLCNSERRVIDVGNLSVNALAFGPDGTWAVSGSSVYAPLPARRNGNTSLDVWGSNLRPTTENPTRSQGERSIQWLSVRTARRSPLGSVTASSWCGTRPLARASGPEMNRG